MQHTRRMCAATPLPSPMRTNFINRTPVTSTICESRTRGCFRHNLSITDIGMRNISYTTIAYRPDTLFNGAKQPSRLAKMDEIVKAHAKLAAAAQTAEAARVTTEEEDSARTFGERVLEKTIGWRPKHYGNVTYGPRNYPYPISRWLGRRFRMKKHKILKRMRFRRYKLAAIANLPFAKMIRVGMLPELKSSKTKAGDTVDAGLSSLLVGAAKSATGIKAAGKRSRPKSKYQV
jgi:hypothetical protein